jgi:hypothetical protein
VFIGGRHDKLQSKEAYSLPGTYQATLGTLSGDLLRLQHKPSAPTIKKCRLYDACQNRQISAATIFIVAG